MEQLQISNYMAEAGRVDLSSFIQNKLEMSIDMVPFSNVSWLSEEHCETKIIKVISALHICVTSLPPAMQFHPYFLLQTFLQK